MSRLLVVAVPALKENHRTAIESAARRHGFDAMFYETAAEALPHLENAEVILGQSASLAQNAPCLKWLCSPSAGVDPTA